MAQAIKHVGNVKDKKVVIAYRTIPNDPYSALVIPVEKLNPSWHDELFKVVESNNGQDANEVATVLAVRKFADGTNILSTLSRAGFLVKVDTKDITITPTPQRETWISLDKLNEEIAKQRGVEISELAIKPDSEQDEEGDKKTIAKNYRARADQLYKEVVSLRRRADEMDPPADSKKATSTRKKVDA